MKKLILIHILLITINIYAKNTPEQALEVAKQYAELEWVVKYDNVINNYTDTNNPKEGYTGQYPCDWILNIGETITGMPYHYGGKDSLGIDINDKIHSWYSAYANGPFGPGAHDYHHSYSDTSSTKWAAGIDCSGFLYYCWELDEATFDNTNVQKLVSVSQKIDIPVEVEPGDAFIFSAGPHARLCYARIEEDENDDRVIVAEAKPDNINRVVLREMSITDMNENNYDNYRYLYEEHGNTISGNLTGTLEAANSPFHVTGDVVVDTTETLIIEPGVNIIFDGYYSFTVYGKLLANGEEEKNIFFKANDANTTGWAGIRFINNQTNGISGNSELNHCKIEDCVKEGYKKQLVNKDFAAPDPFTDGGAIFCLKSNIIVNDCIINNNKAVRGGGIFMSDHCVPEINYTLLSNNESEFNGAGALFHNYCYPLLINCTVANNQVTTNNFDGGGVYWLDHSEPFFANSIFWFNLPNQLHSDFTSSSTLMYCNSEDEVLPGEGNISANPLFNNTQPYPYYLKWENYPTNDETKSPCIDAGYPSMQDPDGSIVDIGAFFFVLDENPEPAPPKPENIQIAVNKVDSTLTITWSGEASNNYTVYSSTNTEASFSADTTGVFAGTSWTAPLTGDKKFFYVIASNGTKKAKTNYRGETMEDIISEHKNKFIEMLNRKNIHIDRSKL